MNILIITDSGSTSLSNSFFTLVLKLRERVKVFILDSAVLENKDFFEQGAQQKLFCYELDQENESYENYIHNRTTTRSFLESDFSSAWIRLDPPVTVELLKHIEKMIRTPLMINSPKGIVKSSTKEFLLNYPELCPDMKLCSSIDDVIEFCETYSAVIKPLNGFGGNGLYRIDGDIGYIEHEKKSSAEVIYEISKKIGKNNSYLAVKYLENIKLGDKRVLVVNKSIVGVINRVPREGSWLANLAQGAKVVSAKVTDQDIKVAEILANDLEAIGVFVFGFDVLINDDGNEVLSEINTINVGGFLQIQENGYPEAIKESSELIYKIIKQHESKPKSA